MLFFSDISISVHYKFFPHLKIPVGKYVKHKHDPFLKPFISLFSHKFDVNRLNRYLLQENQNSYKLENYIYEYCSYAPTQVHEHEQMSERAKIKYYKKLQNAEYWRSLVLYLDSKGYLCSDDFWVGVDSLEWPVTKKNLRAWKNLAFQLNTDLFEHETHTITLASVDVIKSAHLWGKNPGGHFLYVDVLDRYAIRRKVFSELSMQSKYVNRRRNHLKTEEALERFRVYVEQNNVIPKGGVPTHQPGQFIFFR